MADPEGIPPDVERTLKVRADLYAARQVDAADRPVLCRVVIGRREGTLFGFPVDDALEARMVRISRLPMQPAHVDGLFQVRGKAFCLVDIYSVFGSSGAAVSQDTALALLLQNNDKLLAVRLDEVVGTRDIFVDECDHELKAEQLDFISAVTRDLVNLVSVPQLCGRKEFQVSSHASGSSPERRT